MRNKIALAVVLLASIYASAGTCGNGYSYGPIQLKLQKAANTDQTNFGYGGVLTLTALKTVANGGQVQNTANNAMGISGPADMVLCDASSAGNLLKFEVPYYDGTNGVAEIYHLQSTLHTASNDVVYLFLNNAAVVTSQQDPNIGTSTSFWFTVGNTVVCHEPNGSSLNVACSQNSAAAVNHSATATTGQVDGGASLVSGSSQYIDLGASYNTSTITVESWVKPTSYSAAQMIAANLSTGPFNGWEWYMGYGGSSNGIFTLETGSAGSIGDTQSNFPAQLNSFSHLVSTQTGSTAKDYLNGRDVTGTASTPTTIGNAALNVNIGRAPRNGSLFFNGVQDEFRISNSVRSADWVKTTFQELKIPSVAYQPQSVSYTLPTVVNATVCGEQTSASCVMPFPVTSGGLIIVGATWTNGAGCGTLSDTLGLTYTLHISAHENAGGADYYNCIYSAPITATGSETVTLPINSGGGVWGTVREVKNVTASGVATASTVADQPTTITATSPGASSYFVCVTHNIGSVSTPSYPILNINNPNTSGFGNSYYTDATSLVAAGSQSCSFDAGNAGALAIFALAPPSSNGIRHKTRMY